MITPSPSQTAITGKRGEENATQFLRRSGYKLHSRNVRVARDEIDIVGWDPKGKMLVFFEVKARSRFHEDYSPELNMTVSKKRKLRRAAERWMQRRGYEGCWRIDLICVIGKDIVEHREDVCAS